MARFLLWIPLVLSLSACAEESAQQVSVIERGRQLYGRNGCATCHGPDGHGDGQISQMQPSPRDFRQPENFRYGYEVEQIAATIRDGVSSDRSVMPKYGYLPAADRSALAMFIRSLDTPDSVESSKE